MAHKEDIELNCIECTEEDIFGKEAKGFKYAAGVKFAQPLELGAEFRELE